MTKKVQCQIKTKTDSQNVRVKIVKAPFVDTNELKRIIFSRARALVL